MSKKSPALSRRELLKLSGAVAVASTAARVSPVLAGEEGVATANSGTAAVSATSESVVKRKSRVIQWKNWSAGQSCVPSARVTPRSESALGELIRGTKGSIRAVGSGHSFSPLVPTDGTIVSLARMTGVIDHNPETMEADIWAGTRMADLGDPLWERDQAMINMADIDQQTLAGAISTSTHGTGKDLQSYSAMVNKLNLVTASGETIECSKDKNEAVFQAAKVSLGSLGVITQVRLQNRKPYNLKLNDQMMKTEDAISVAEEMRANNRHFEMFPLLHSKYTMVQTLNITDEPADKVEQEAEKEITATFKTVAKLTRMMPFLRTPIINIGASGVKPSEAIDRSYRIFSNVRDVRFNEMEYSMPYEAGPECLREILSTVKKQKIDVVFPLEYRYVKADDNWISPFYQRDSVSISVHQFHDLPYQEYFDLMEKIFAKYEGRPHFGKLHSLGDAEFSKLYPKWQDFKEVRESLDPEGRFLNDHLRKVFGTV